MKKRMAFFGLLFVLMLISTAVDAQCSLCTKTAMQLGEKPALGLNQGILYLMMSPFIIMGYIGYRWWKNNREA